MFKQGRIVGLMSLLVLFGFGYALPGRASQPVAEGVKRITQDEKKLEEMTTPTENCEDAQKPRTNPPGQWGFSSDHLPVGARAQIGDTEFGIATFNVLDELHKHYIQDKDGQNLGGSTLDKMTEAERTQENVQIIKDGLLNQNVGVFCIQEASYKFYKALKKSIGPEFDILKIQSGSKDDYGLLVYDKRKFDQKPTKFGDRLFSMFSSDTGDAVKTVPYRTSKGKKNKYIQAAQLNNKSDGTSFVVVNTHTEFGQAQQFVDYLNKIEGPVIAMGDLNLGYHDGRKETQVSVLGNLKGGYQLLENHTPFSHINTQRLLDTYDHIISKKASVAADPQLTQALQKTFSLNNR